MSDGQSDRPSDADDAVAAAIESYNEHERRSTLRHLTIDLES